MVQPEMRSIVDVAKASVNAYNEKNWEKVRATLTPDCVYEEIATNRKAHGVNDTIALWQGWAKAMPDSKATFDNQIVKDNTVVLEITWRGTHSGPLQTPRGEIAPTGRRFELRACQIVNVSGERANTVRHYFDMNTLFQQLNISV
jgi:steroid delta-isomerase-like uncharacterized protein